MYLSGSGGQYHPKRFRVVLYIHRALIFDAMLCRQPFGCAHGSRPSRAAKEAFGKHVAHHTSRGVSDIPILVIDIVVIPTSKAFYGALVAGCTALPMYVWRESPMVTISGPTHGSFVVVLKKASPGVCFSCSTSC